MDCHRNASRLTEIAVQSPRAHGLGLGRRVLDELISPYRRRQQLELGSTRLVHCLLGARRK